MHVFERALPLALTVFCGVVGGFYTFQPIFANDAQKKIDSPPRDLIPTIAWKEKEIAVFGRAPTWRNVLRHTRRCDARLQISTPQTIPVTDLE
ncbi:hypothetical protein H9Q72_008431 [Fusarium xylarioides]|uniref:Uncharacterized protein n=1 Tax=Fusarium xylarioides TaxID=221167 RepID=A0A9P7HTS3_9HYPO|nr:hypothetical protein H9Q72_008431 [Fusarium xylarioides]